MIDAREQQRVTRKRRLRVIVREFYAGQDDPLIELLTDVRHYCDARHVDFHGIVDDSYSRYINELG